MQALKRSFLKSAAEALMPGSESLHEEGRAPMLEKQMQHLVFAMMLHEDDYLYSWRAGCIVQSAQAFQLEQPEAPQACCLGRPLPR